VSCRVRLDLCKDGRFSSVAIMSGRKDVIRRAMLRAAIGPLLVYALVIQALFLPFARARAMEAALTQASLGLLCTMNGLESDPSDESGDTKHRMHGLDCCLPGRPVLADLPVLLPSATVTVVPVRTLARIDLAVTPEARGPPPVAETPLQPRAPPFPA